MDKHNVAIVGLGGMGSGHAKWLTAEKRANLVGTYDIDPARQDYARSMGYRTYESLADVLADESVEIVLIATPNHLHKDIAILAMRAGKNVICEKPATVGCAELAEVIKVSKETGKLFVVHQNRRWDEGYLVMKQLYREKTLGEVFNIESRVLGGRGIPGDWRGKKEFGGGMLYDWGVHLIDQMLQLTDEKIKKIYCQCTHVTNKEVDDGFKLLLTFANGMTAHIEVGTCNFISLPMWYMAGDQGTAIIGFWDMEGKVVKLHSWEDKDAKPIEAASGLTKTMAPRDGNSVEELPIPRIQSNPREYYANVFDYLEGKADILVKNEQVMRVLRVIELALESAAKNQALDFE